jgi:hypothetical protein
MTMAMLASDFNCMERITDPTSDHIPNRAIRHSIAPLPVIEST